MTRRPLGDPAEATFHADAFGGLGYHSKSYTLVNLATGFSLPTSGGRTVEVDFQLRLSTALLQSRWNGRAAERYGAAPQRDPDPVTARA
jgi:hypothetical protein